jgi:hypothetical protein
VALLTGFASAPGTVAATDTLLSAVGKLDGNDALKAPTASLYPYIGGKLLTYADEEAAIADPLITGGDLYRKTAGGIDWVNADNVPSLDLRFATDKTLTARRGPTPAFTRASTATFVGSDGLIQSSAVNSPRFDHDPVTLACKGLLIEGSRTNLVFPSAALTTQTRTVTAAAHTLSFYGTGTIVLSGVHVATVTGTGAYPTRTTLTFTPTAGSLILTVTGSVTQAQLEAGSFPTSYIPTTTGSVVRSADVCSITGADFTSFYNNAAGTLLSKAMIANLIGDNRGIAQIDSGTTDNIIRHGYSLADGGFLGAIRANTDATSLLAIAAGAASVIQKRAIAYEGTSFASATNGGSVATVTRTFPVGLNAFRIGGLTAGGFLLNGHIAEIKFFKKRLPNAKLQALTAP